MKKLPIILGAVGGAALVAVAANVCDCPGCPGCASILSPQNLTLGMLGAVLVGGAGFSAFRGKVAALLVVLVLLTGMTSVSYAADNQKSVAGDAPMSLTIGELTTNPQLYVGKEVTVIARVVGICEEDGCLTLKDKTDVIEGVPPEGGFKKNPEAGSTLRVTGTVKMKKGEVHIDVKSFEEVKK